MVSPGDQQRDYPQFSLDQIKALAMEGKVQYASGTVENDVENLGYSPETVHQCLATLEPQHFQRAIRYQNREVWLDEYQLKFASPTGDVDELYIKLRLNKHCVTILLHSLHQQRYG